MFNSGFIKSITFGVPSFAPTDYPALPSKFSMEAEMPSPINQGDKGICVSVCVTDMVRYIYKVTERVYRKHVDFYYNHRSDKRVDGMSPRNAFEIAQANSLIMSYATIKSATAAKISILSHGPVLVALPVYSYFSNFWKQSVVQQNVLGYHAVTLVGYNDSEECFKLRNSWGTSWGMNGYSWFPYEDFNLILESWVTFR